MSSVSDPYYFYYFICGGWDPLIHYVPGDLVWFEDDYGILRTYIAIRPSQPTDCPGITTETWREFVPYVQ